LEGRERLLPAVPPAPGGMMPGFAFHASTFGGESMGVRLVAAGALVMVVAASLFVMALTVPPSVTVVPIPYTGYEGYWDVKESNYTEGVTTIYAGGHTFVFYTCYGYEDCDLPYVVYVDFEANSTVDVYVFSSLEYDKWVNGLEAEAVVYMWGVESGQFNFTVKPSEGELASYYIVFDNSEGSGNVAVSYDVDETKPSYELRKVPMVFWWPIVSASPASGVLLVSSFLTGAIGIGLVVAALVRREK